MDQPPAPAISELFAFITDEATAIQPAGEGIVAIRQRGELTPLVGATMARVDQLRPLAKMVSEMRGVRITLVRFSVREDLETILPAGSGGA